MDSFVTPRPFPRLLGPVLAGSLVVALALPVFLIADWPLAGWLLGAILWAGAQALGALLLRLPLGADHAASSGVIGIGMLFRAVAVGAVAIAAAASDATLGLAAAAVYGLAYTLELALAFAAYFGAEPA